MGTLRFCSCCQHFSPIVTVFRPLGAADPSIQWAQRGCSVNWKEVRLFRWRITSIQWCLSFLFLFLFSVSILLPSCFSLLIPYFSSSFLHSTFTSFSLFTSLFPGLTFPFAISSAKLRKATLSFVFFVRLCICLSKNLFVCLSVRMERLGSHWDELKKCDVRVLVFLEKLSRKFYFH